MSSGSSSSSQGAGHPRTAALTARQLLAKRAVWVFPLVMGSVAAAALAAFYVGSVVDPVAHLHGLPVAIVNSDDGAVVGARQVDFGQQLQAGLSRSPAVAARLAVTDTTRRAAEQSMDTGGSYAAVLIPADFTASLLELAGGTAGGPRYQRPQIVILTNQRAGTTGVSLATGVLEPALAAASRQIGRKLTASAPASGANPVSRTFLGDPVTVTTTEYRPLPGNAALGLSAFYIALLTLMCGFLSGIVVHTSVDAALGYATTEIGPRWRQRQPQLISRWQTLLIKWAIAVVLAGLTTGGMLLVAVAGLGMAAPHAGLLWLLAWLAATSVAEGTIVLFAILGASTGQLLALLIFVYAGLASAGGTVPIQALPVVLRWLAEVEPLRQILAGTRSVLYFNARADAGLTRAVAAAAAGLVFWLAAGTILVRWYDRRGLARIDPRVLEYVSQVTQQYTSPAPCPHHDDPGPPPGQPEPPPGQPEPPPGQPEPPPGQPEPPPRDLTREIADARALGITTAELRRRTLTARIDTLPDPACRAAALTGAAERAVNPEGNEFCIGRSAAERPAKRPTAGKPME